MIGINQPSIDAETLGVRLADARRARRLTQADAAEHIGVARTTITAIEKGQRHPRNLELIKLADLYGRQAGDLLQPSPPAMKTSFADQFRHAHQIPDDRGLADLATFERFCRWYAEFEQTLDAPLPIRDTPAYDTANTSGNRAGAEVAYAERLRLGLGDGPVGGLWDLLESEYGLRVFGFAMEESRLSGMYVFVPDLGGCLAINANHPVERQRWTAAHELGHYLTDRHRVEVSLQVGTPGRNRSEQLADSFVRHFLMPTGGLERRFEQVRRSKSGPITPADVVVLGHLYGVSFQAMTWRLEELNLLKPGTWEILQEVGFKPAQARKTLGLEARAQEPFLPQRYKTIAVQAHDAGQLSEGQLAHRLGLTRVETRDLVAGIKEGLVLDADDEWMAIELDLDQPLATTQ